MQATHDNGGGDGRLVYQYDLGGINEESVMNSLILVNPRCILPFMNSGITLE